MTSVRGTFIVQFVSFLGGSGPTYGLVVGDGVVDLGRRGPHASLRAAIAAGDLLGAGAAAAGETPDARSF